jgi:predicted aconitase with swiveling domain
LRRRCRRIIKNLRHSAAIAYRSPGSFFGYCDTGTSRFSDVRTILLCSLMCAAG